MNLWANSLQPTEGTPAEWFAPPEWPGVQGPRVRRIDLADALLREFPSRKMSRTLTRTGSLLFAAARPLAPRLAGYSGREVGIYCAMEPHPGDTERAFRLGALPARDPKFPKRYLKGRKPKGFLREFANLMPAQLAMHFGIQGPVYLYTHSLHGARHALDQARSDCRAGRVRAALVCTAFSFEDPLVVLRTHSDFPDATLAEGAACLLLTAESGPDCLETTGPAEADYFGIADPLIRAIRGVVTAGGARP